MFRTGFFALFTCWIVARIRVSGWLWGPNRARAMRIRQRWAKGLLRGAGIQVTVEGTPPTHPVILVANHRSYLDPLLLLRDVWAYPVSKDELATWPVLGEGARQAGTLFVPLHDASFRRARLLLEIEKVLQEGFSVIIFPEGTTSELVETLPFRKGVFQLAAKRQLTIVPVALVLPEKADCWITQESFLTHAWRRLRQPSLPVRVHYGLPLSGADAEVLMHTAQDWVNEVLRRFPIR